MSSAHLYLELIYTHLCSKKPKLSEVTRKHSWKANVSSSQVTNYVQHICGIGKKCVVYINLSKQIENLCFCMFILGICPCIHANAGSGSQ